MSMAEAIKQIYQKKNYCNYSPNIAQKQVNALILILLKKRW